MSTCKICKFNDEGTCRRMPPIALMEKLGTGPYGADIMGPCSHQPYVSADDWCGEFEARPEDVKKAVDAILSNFGKPGDIEKLSIEVAEKMQAEIDEFVSKPDSEAISHAIKSVRWVKQILNGKSGFACTRCKVWIATDGGELICKCTDVGEQP